MLTVFEDKRTADGKTFADGEDRDLDYEMGLMTTSRLGARVRVDERASGFMELSLAESGVTVRHMVGYWDFGPATLAIGQTRTPIGRQDSTRTRNNDLGLTAFGEPYLGRRPLVQWKVRDFTMAMVKPHAMTNIYENEEVGSELDNLMPRLEVSWQRNVGATGLDAFGGFHSYRISAPHKYFTIDSGMIGAGVYWKPDPAYVRAIGYFSRNARQFGQYLSPQPASFGSAKINAQDEVVDNNTLAAALFGGYTFTDRVRAQLGYGYIQSKDDVSGADTEKWQCYYAQATFTLYRGITITPEIGVMEDIETNQRIAYIGAKWQADF